MANFERNLLTTVQEVLPTFGGIFIRIIHAAIEALNNGLVWGGKLNQSVETSVCDHLPSSSTILKCSQIEDFLFELSILMYSWLKVDLI